MDKGKGKKLESLHALKIDYIYIILRGGRERGSMTFVKRASEEKWGSKTNSPYTFLCLSGLSASSSPFHPFPFFLFPNWNTLSHQQLNIIQLIFYFCYICLSVGCLVGRSVGWPVVLSSFPKKAGKFHFHAPIGAIIYDWH